MVDSATHYRILLAKHYSWMLGTAFEDAVTEQRRQFTELGIGPGRLAVDLGCGPGYQAAALADLGFAKVLALDTSQTLLDELVEHRGSRPIEPICDDILRLPQYAPNGSIDVTVCIGDTLPHLESMAQVRALLQACWHALRPSGRLLLTFRDYSQALHGLDRIIPVRFDADRLMTCILDYTTDHVEVTDLIYTRVGAGWNLQKSSYRKLRLIPDEVAALLRSLGFAVAPLAGSGRMTKISAMKPD
jgi:SAM-dependent methyltransferase